MPFAPSAGRDRKPRNLFSCQEFPQRMFVAMTAHCLGGVHSVSCLPACIVADAAFIMDQIWPESNHRSLRVEGCFFMSLQSHC